MDNDLINEVLTQSLEIYLKTIYELIEANSVARVSEIARRLDVKNSSVTNAIQILADKNLINYRPYKSITLTDNGLQQAQAITRKYDLLRRFFEDVLRIEPEEARVSSDKMMHSISDNVQTRLIQYLEYVHSCTKRKISYMDSYGFICELSSKDKDCEKCEASEEKVHSLL